MTKELFSLNSKKSGTFGDIPTKVLKISSDICNKVLQKIWNSEILGKQYFHQNITTVFEKKDPMQAENYRPASVLPTVSKMFEWIIQKQLSTQIEVSFHLICVDIEKGSQFALISLIEKWRKYPDNKGYTGAVLMNLSKAFDTINHEILVAKLHAYGFNKDSLKILLSYLSNCWQRTKINLSFSSWSELLQGVLPGSALGPILFNIYINDLFYFLTSDICNFADDTTPYVCDSSLAYVLEKLEEYSAPPMEWFEINEMKMNVEKYHSFISGNKFEQMWVRIRDGMIWGNRTVKLLGITIRDW